MTIQNIDIGESIKHVKDLLSKNKNITPELKGAVELLIVVITLLVNKLGLNSSNSSKPPSSDPNRCRRKKKKAKGIRRKPGGQKGHNGTNLKPHDRSLLPLPQKHIF